MKFHETLTPPNPDRDQVSSLGLDSFLEKLVLSLVDRHLLFPAIKYE